MSGPWRKGALQDDARYAPPAMPFASFPPASSVPDQRLRASDLADATFQSNGTRWRPEGGRQLITPNISQPIYIAPSGSVGANGALTLGTAMLFAQNCWLYFPAGKVYVGSVAGFYYAALSTTTIGTIYDNIYTPSSRNWDFPASPTPIVAAGPGAYTGETATVTVINIAIPAGLLGPTGQLASYLRINANNTAGGRLVEMRFGGSVYAARAFSNFSSESQPWSLANAGRVSRQVSAYNGDTGLVSGNPGSVAVDTASATTLTAGLKADVATDWVGAVGYFVELIA